MAGTKRRQDNETRTSKKPRTPSRSTSSRAVTRQATRRAAAASTNAVLLTTELLEDILHHLPMKELLLAQRVSRKWRDLIRQSIVLQQQLFMRPREAAFAWKWVNAEGGKTSHLKRITVDEYNQTPDNHGQMSDLSGELNTLIFKQLRFNDERLIHEIYDGDGQQSFGFRPSHAVHEEKASWREMFLTQPPATRVSPVIMLDGLRSIHIDDIVESEGVRAGMLAEVIIKETENEAKQVQRPSRHYFTTADCICPNDEEMRMELLEYRRLIHL
ncbi:hypothetical protein LTR10_006406 [Elasticomyces elasticus]|nr:hypothetical protein LTR10_006406 [Elasticomyces elasticus]KAK4966546.1 hypothetical protein LTR42_010856 [Elasticomyces elasticus]